ncbi:MAG: GntR family transcriptional regulator [Rhodospirillaceae bacterium]|nr:GntR family transcriptional regulator [Rhodospirillaceae bacterium]|tara:strand:+ start:2498 stop:3235 length:738 start_codon:yes stop_codon:yes gene_type:complete
MIKTKQTLCQETWPQRSPLRAPKLGDRVYEQIVERIVDGTLAEGDRLLSEHAFCRMFEVSRPVVREALARLRADGIIDSRQGSGSYVRRRPVRDLLCYGETTNAAQLLRCFEFRIALEGEATALAATRHTAHDLRVIRAASEACNNAAEDGRLGKQEDLEFHMAIARASGNALFAETMELLHDDIQNGMDTARNLGRSEQKKRFRILREEHGAVLEAIEDNDADRACVAMRSHLHNAQRRIVGSS